MEEVPDNVFALLPSAVLSIVVARVFSQDSPAQVCILSRVSVHRCSSLKNLVSCTAQRNALAVDLHHAAVLPRCAKK